MKTILFTDRLGAHSIWSLLDSIAEELIKKGNKVIYCRFDDGLQGSPRVVPNGVILYDIKVLQKKRPWDLLKQHREFSKALSSVFQNYSVDIIHTNFAIPAISARIVASKCNVPYIVSTQHELYQSMSLHLRIGLRLTQHLVDHIFYISNEVKKSFTSKIFTDTDKSSIIYNGIDIDNLRENIPKNFFRLPLINKEQEINIVCAGRMVPIKGQRILLEALPEILKQYPNCKLTLIGSGPDEEDLRQLAKSLDITKHVTFTGWIERSLAMSIILTSDLMVIPSSQEGFGLVLAEAMALEVPVVCSDIPVFREVIGSKSAINNALFEVMNPADLAEKVLNLLADEMLKQQLVKDGFDRVVNTFTQEKMVESYLNIYSKLDKK